MPTVLKSGNLNLLEPSGPVQACNGIALPLPYVVYSTLLPVWRAATARHSEVQGLVQNVLMLFQLLSPKLFLIYVCISKLYFVNLRLINFSIVK